MLCLLLLYNTVNRSDESGSAGAVIGGVIGGVVVFILIIVLCIVVVLVSWSYQKSICSNSKGNSNQDTPTTIPVVNSEYSAKLGTNSDDYINNDHLVTPNRNQGHSVSESYGLSNSTYDTEQNENINITIQPNPCYSVAEQNSNSGKNQYSYVEFNKFTKNIPPGHTDDYVEMQDPSLINQETNTESQRSNVQMTNNPSYIMIK